ncbi:MAG: LPS export ABC transporter periplasmic protein LptC [Pseudomonadota bacterium]
MPMHKRTAHRGWLLLTITVGAMIAFGSFWLVELINRTDPRIDPDAFKGEPDYIVENFSVVRMTPEGKPRYLLSGAKLTHHPHDDTSDVVKPLMKNVAPGAPPVTIRANTARVRHVENQVDLMGAVDILRPATPAAQFLHLETEALTVFPDEDRMASDHKISVKLGTASIVGNGVRANNATRLLQFGGRGQIVYPPNRAR